MRERMYEIYDEEKFIGKLSADELKRRYSIVPAEDECITKNITQELCREWDKTRLKILHKGRVKI